MPEQIDLLVHNCGKLATLAGPDRPRVGAEMRELGLVADGAVAIRAGKIVATGATGDLRGKYAPAAELDAGGNLVLPGFVDCHTHLIFAGSREHELALRLEGATYLEILAAGGGIHGTVRATRAASAEELEILARARLAGLLRHGTTTVEIKSGYGLDLETEKKMLQVAARVAATQPLDVIPTFLGAHAVPPEVERRAYVDFIIAEVLPELRGWSEFCDVFCESGAFTLAESERILTAAKAAGYGLKIHAGQFTDLGAAGMAAGLGAASADHLEEVSAEQLERMRAAGTVAVLLPGTPFFLLAEKYADARRLLDAEVAVALATDFNPGSCPSYSMPMMIALAVLKMGMTAAEAIVAATVNAAWAVGRGDRLGSLEPGKQADLIVLDLSGPELLPYHFGVNPVRRVVKAGKVLG